MARIDLISEGSLVFGDALPIRSEHVRPVVEAIRTQCGVRLSRAVLGAGEGSRSVLLLASGVGYGSDVGHVPITIARPELLRRMLTVFANAALASAFVLLGAGVVVVAIVLAEQAVATPMPPVPEEEQQADWAGPFPD